MGDVVQFERLTRLLAGTLPAGADDQPAPSDDEIRQRSLRAIFKVYAWHNPPPPLDRLTPDELARFRLRARARPRP